MSVCLAVIAKAPVPGRVKTRLCPPCTPDQAAYLAEGALIDTLQAVAETPASRYVCVLDGAAGDWLPDGFEVFDQRGDGLDERLASAFEALPEPTFLVGMDTPQLTPRLLMAAGDALMQPGADAVIGRVEDGGYWGIGLRPRDDVRALFEGVPMSRTDTYEHQLERLLSHGLGVVTGLPVLVDVDDIDDARRVANGAIDSTFARRYLELGFDDGGASERLASRLAARR